MIWLILFALGAVFIWLLIKFVRWLLSLTIEYEVHLVETPASQKKKR